MERSKLTWGMACLALAVLFYIVDFVKVSFALNATTWRIYPAAGLALLGLVLLWSSWKAGLRAR